MMDIKVIVKMSLYGIEIVQEQKFVIYLNHFNLN